MTLIVNHIWNPAAGKRKPAAVATVPARDQRQWCIYTNPQRRAMTFGK